MAAVDRGSCGRSFRKRSRHLQRRGAKKLNRNRGFLTYKTSEFVIRWRGDRDEVREVDTLQRLRERWWSPFPFSEIGGRFDNILSQKAES